MAKSIFPRRWTVLVWMALSWLTRINLIAGTDPGAIKDANVGWRYIRGNQPGAETSAFDDSSWRTVDLPHDWSIETEPGSDPSTGPHDHLTPEGSAAGYLRGGIGWYRLHFKSQPAETEKELELIVHAAQQECDIWVNGDHLAFQPHGYMPVRVEIAHHLKPAAQDNVIAIRVLNPEANTRWYSGSGLYRGVSLRAHPALQIPTWGTRIDTVWLNNNNAQLQFRVEVQNDSPSPQDLTLEAEISSPNGTQTKYGLGTLRISPATTEIVSQSVEISSVEPWSPESPKLYRAEVRLIQRGSIVNASQTRFGVRTIAVDAQAGFRLNGKSVKLRGACLHHDNGLLGAAAFPDAERRRVRLMKANGFNAIRTSHNPPSTAFLEACDEEGILVIDEFADTWELPKKPNGYQRYFIQHWQSDLGTMLARDFNHPSVIMWSIGNEIGERFNPRGLAIGSRLAAFVRGQDARRPVTNAINFPWENANLGTNWETNDPAFALLDVGGYNYAWDKYESDHARFPQRVMAGTESYPRQALENWKLIEAHPYVIGDFVWTGMDHIGESGIGHDIYIDQDADPRTVGPQDWTQMPWPIWLNWCGDLDLIGNKKPQSYYRDVVWGRSPIEVAVHEPIPAGKKEKVGAWGWPAELLSWNWTGREGKPLEVSVYAKAGRVRLELNGRLVGEKEIDRENSITASFTVPWEKGVLIAKAFDQGRMIAQRELRTTGEPHSIKFAAETSRSRAARDSLLFIPVDVLDSHGEVIPDAEVELKATVTGEAELKAFGSANPEDLHSFTDSSANSFRGHALLILRSTGKPGAVRVEIGSAGLPPVVYTFEFLP